MVNIFGRVMEAGCLQIKYGGLMSAEGIYVVARCL